jgi:transcriptional regulator with XRE-family HTH domain
LQQLRAEREQLGISQRELGRRLQKPHTYIGKCESGERQLNIAELKFWCDALDIPFSEFIQHLEKEWQADS